MIPLDFSQAYTKIAGAMKNAIKHMASASHVTRLSWCRRRGEKRGDTAKTRLAGEPDWGPYSGLPAVGCLRWWRRLSGAVGAGGQRLGWQCCFGKSASCQLPAAGVGPLFCFLLVHTTEANRRHLSTNPSCHSQQNRQSIHKTNRKAIGNYLGYRHPTKPRNCP